MKRPGRQHAVKSGGANSSGTRKSGSAIKRPALQAAAPAFVPPGVQRKMVVGKPNSPYEREADAVADRVMQGVSAPAISRLPAAGLGATQRKPEKGEEGEKDSVQAQAEDQSEEEEPVQAQVEEEEEVPAQAQAEDEEDTAQAQLEEEEEPVQAETAEEEAVQSQAEEAEEEPVQAQAEDEEEAVQAAAEEEEEAPVQAQAEEESEEETVQSKAEEEPEEEQPVQARTASGAGRRERSKSAEEVLRNPGAGRAMPPGVREPIERSTGADLSEVRVHDDGPSQRAAKDIGARAFTHGRDIWLGPGASAHDTRLMAHEATHVVQQSGKRSAPAAPATKAVAQRTADTPNPNQRRLVSGETEADLRNDNNKTLIMPEVSLPDVANKDSPTSELIARPPGNRPSDQRPKWLDEITLDPTSFDLPADKNVPTADGRERYFLKFTDRTRSFVVGTREEIAAQSRLPNWNKRGRGQYFQVDHVQEWQIGGTHDLDNFQLLDATTNQNSGNALRGEIRDRIEAARDLLLGAVPTVDSGQEDIYSPLRKSADEIRGSFKSVKFRRKSGTPLGGVRGPDDHWTKDEIEAGDHVNALRPLSSSEAAQFQLLGDPTNVVVYLGGGASRPRNIRWGNDGPVGSTNRRRWGGKGFDLTGVSGDASGATSLTADIYKRTSSIRGEGVTVPLSPLSGEEYTYVIGDLTSIIRNNVSLDGLSPITVDFASIGDDALITRGTVRPSPQIFKRDVAIDLEINGDEIRISKTFTAGEFDIPGPVTITDSALTVSAGVGGGGPSLSVDGNLNFEVDRVGKGNLRGMGSTSGGFSVEGTFDFDPALFRGADAQITVGYADDTFTGSGTLKIGDGQITGIRSAELTVNVENDVWSAEGSVEPKIPGVSQGTLSMTFDPNGGFEILGELTLGAEIPRLKSGKINARLAKEGEEYKVSAGGTAELDIPGVDAGLTVSYDDGTFNAEANVAYARGLASGTLSVGATNMPVDPETGMVTEGDPTDTVAIFGSGSVTIRFTPWLEGTAGLAIKPDGQMEVTGRVALPSSLEVFPEKSLDRELISVGVDIPIVGVAVAGQRIGIFLNISGALNAKASIGPGTLEDVAVEVTYNPEDESSARITGSARFVVPAEAGLRLAIQGAIGAGIPVVSARAGLEIGGELGVEGEASASAQVEWTPANGLSMEAEVGVSAAPKFTFDITGFVDVTADLLLTEIELYSKRWQLAAFEYGSGKEVGAKLTVKVENNEVQPISMNDIEFTAPDIDPVAIARGLISQVA